MENADHIIRGALKKAQAAPAQYLGAERGRTTNGRLSRADSTDQRNTF
jgi:hypothetical protein